MSIARAMLIKDRKTIQDTLMVLEKDLESYTLESKVLAEAINLAKDCIDEASQSRQLLEEGVTQGLQFIFEKDFVFKILNVLSADGDIKGNKLSIEYRGVVIEEIEEVLGTGVKKVTDFLLFLYCLAVQKATRKLIVADEILNSLADEVWERLGVWICPLCEAFDMQLILTTHHQTTFGKVYLIQQGDDGVSTLTEQCSE